MTLLHRFCRTAPALAFALMVSLPAGAAMTRGAGPGQHQALTSEATASAVQTSDLDAMRGNAAMSRGEPTLSVNIAIVVLGTAWLVLMVRRIQLRSAMGDLRHEGPQPAAGGR